jgi:DNA end-binding protein Ku
MPKPKTVPNKLLVGFSDEQLATLDKWRRAQEDLPTRSEGVRRLVDDGLARMGSGETWKGFLRLSLVTCPVALIPATDAQGLDETAPKSSPAIDEFVPRSHTIEIDEFVPRSEIDPRYMIRPYYLRPDGKVGHDAFAVIRETVRSMNKVAIGRVVLTNREHIIALDPLDKGMIGTLLRYPHEVRSKQEYFDEIQDVKVTKDMLDLAKHIVERMSGHFELGKYENHYKGVSTNPPVEEQNRRPIADNVINLMDALKKSLAKEREPKRLAATKK